MKNSYWILSVFFCFCIGCTKDKIKLNSVTEKFDSFPLEESLKFVPVADFIPDEPSKMLLRGDNLIIQTFCKAKEKHLVIYSLTKKQVINEAVKYGDGPNEILSCEICLNDNKLWLYDMMKKQIGENTVSSYLSGNPLIHWHKLENYYYDIAILNDSIMLGTNNMQSKHKISYINLSTGKVTGKANYSYLDNSINLGALIDASSCYIDINSKTKDILLSYRYTDMIEIYDMEGNLKYALQGPEKFDIEFSPAGKSMRKTKETRKAFVNSYVTEKYIYLLYSGCKRTEENWPYGTEIFVFSWNGKPIKKYTLGQPVYAFAVDEENQKIYSFSTKIEQLIMATYNDHDVQ